MGHMNNMPSSVATQKVTNKKHIMMRLLKNLKGQYPTLIAVFVLTAIGVACQVTAPSLFKALLSQENLQNYFSYTAEGTIGTLNVVWTEIYKPFLIIALLYTGNSLFAFLGEFLVCKLGAVLAFKMRDETKQKIDNLPLSYFDTHTYGEILSRMTNDIDLISNSVQQIFTQVIKGVLLLGGVTIAMFITQWQLALITLTTIPFSLITSLIIARSSQKYFIANQEITGKLNGHIEEIYGGYQIIKLFNKEEDVNKKFNEINSDLCKVGKTAQFRSGIIQPALGFVHNIGYVFVCVAGGLIQDVGSIAAFFIFLNQFQQPINQIASISNVIQQTSAAASRVFEILDENEEIKDTTDALSADIVTGAIEFKDVAFSYKPETPLIQHMNLKVEPGDAVAIVGPTGAGKTTIVNLIMRFYELTGGEITLDGTNLTNYKRSSLRDSIGMVLQDAWLFNGTIAENIAYGREGATIEDVKKAAKEAHAHHFISTLPDNYDTIINEEASNISQGQRQLLTIARAIISEPRILILDEATSSVDTRTEKIIQEALTSMMKNRTSFVIAHRLSTIKNAKMIMVMNKGNIVEIGNHENLLKAKGFYYDLYNAQFMGQNIDDKAKNI